MSSKIAHAIPPQTPTASVPQQSSQNDPKEISSRVQPDDLDVTRNNEATNEFQARTIELRNQRPQWITYYQ
jgi:hypothetical protein